WASSHTRPAIRDTDGGRPQGAPNQEVANDCYRASTVPHVRHRQRSRGPEAVCAALWGGPAGIAIDDDLRHRSEPGLFLVTPYILDRRQHRKLFPCPPQVERVFVGGLADHALDTRGRRTVATEGDH